ncbi:hypothetical protein PSCICM_30730 [Pseudomonas cichorii]|uniref:Uncharacterized protein n=1 Tax=Pseudomonas cichorii TaxID=36746 RepID=A0ABQ1DLY7_PSECI|nr:hypothetical protein PSCICM_30730 [Pseudomonas cichorii]GFM91989.1 hypothetical protein PSCICP_19610 [Pseudomonas cichorii]SDN75205.1 hypothetical protein SAMN05216599_103204 [Pseudomonas cichorii]
MSRRQVGGEAASYKRQATSKSGVVAFGKNLLLLETPNLQLAALFLFDLVEHEQRIIAELRLELRSRHRAAEEVALDFVAAVFA